MFGEGYAYPKVHYVYCKQDQVPNGREDPGNHQQFVSHRKHDDSESNIPKKVNFNDPEQKRNEVNYTYDPNDTHFPRSTIENGRIKAPPQFSYANAPEPTGPVSILKRAPGQLRSRSVSPGSRYPPEIMQQGYYGHPYPPMMGPYPYMPPNPYCYYPPGNPVFPYPYMNPYMPYHMQPPMPGMDYL
ncbi:WW domain-binding protein 11 [Nasonia vitripennis]|uniref:Uncharacterized protein n=1 Tax=Nasonia vitripennis TaxID=7425 RepID=A0A7M7LTZ3_NASVI|nr:WW domain-binding protein 11 [Nasonia vitripennis]